MLITQYLTCPCNKAILTLFPSEEIEALSSTAPFGWCTVYPKKYAHGFVVLCFVVVMQSFTMNSYEVFIHIHQGCFAGTGAIVRLPQCQWSKPDGYGKISQCITTTKHSKAKTVCIFLGIYCMGCARHRTDLPLQLSTIGSGFHLSCVDILSSITGLFTSALHGICCHAMKLI